MQQRVALARALVNLPKVLLLDEPLGALDLKLRKGLQVELKRIQREVGITFVYVTHDQEEALTMSDRIAVMNRGRVEQVGDPEEVYDRPATTFVAGFIGVSNLMPATVSGAGRGAARQRARRRRRHRTAAPRATAATRWCGPRSCGSRRSPASGAAQTACRRSRASSRARSTSAPSTQIVVDLGDEVRMTVLVPNASEAERQPPPGRRRPGRAELGAGAHAHRAPVELGDRNFEQRGRRGGRRRRARGNHERGVR